MSAKLTLLEIVQKVLSDMDRDEVNSVSDTVEATQVASIAEDVYAQLILNSDIPEREGLLQIEGLGDVTLPNYLKLPTSVDRIKNLRYNKIKDGETAIKYEELIYMTPEAFLDMILSRNTDNSDVDSITDTSGVTLPILNDTAPTYWTSFDDEHIVCDSYDSDVDTTLQGSKTVAIGTTIGTFDASDDDYVPDMDDNLFPMYLAEVKSTAAVTLGQQANPKAEQQARKQKTKYQNNRHRIESGYREGPNYGRK